MLTVGMAAALWLTFEATKLRLQHPENLWFYFAEHKGASYYIAHGLHLAFLFPAGFLAWLAFRRRAGQPDPTLRLLLFFVAAGIMTYRGYSLGDFFSTKLVGPTGPVPCLMSALIFIGAERDNWVFLRRLIATLAAVLSATVLLVSFSTAFYYRNYAVAALGLYLNALFFPAAWLLLDHSPISRAPRVLRWVPLVIYAFGTVLVQTRLNVVMILALLTGYFYLQRGQRRGPLVFSGLVAASVVVALLPTLVPNSVVGQSLSRSAALFQARATEDTRTEQLVDFFKDLTPADLVLGRGAQATWRWGPFQWAGGTDVGYLSLLLFGGLPLLFTYCSAHIAGALQCARDPGAPTHAACAIIVLLWALRMFSSSYPSFTIDYYVVLFCVGGCCAWPRTRHRGGHARVMVRSHRTVLLPAKVAWLAGNTSGSN
jgi:hypothetical protein